MLVIVVAYVVTIIHLSGDFDQLISSKPSLRTVKKIGEQNPDYDYSFVMYPPSTEQLALFTSK